MVVFKQPVRAIGLLGSNFVLERPRDHVVVRTAIRRLGPDLWLGPLLQQPAPALSPDSCRSRVRFGVAEATRTALLLTFGLAGAG